MSNATIYRRVLEHFGGSPAKLAAAVRANSTAAVCNWENRAIPLDKVKALEAITGMSVRELRPDDWHLYWPEPAPKSRKRRPAAEAA
jgi:hypothetical protein